MQRRHNQSTLQPLPDSLCKHWVSVWSCDQSSGTLSLQPQLLDSRGNNLKPAQNFKMLRKKTTTESADLNKNRPHLGGQTAIQAGLSGHFCDEMQDFEGKKG